MCGKCGVELRGTPGRKADDSFLNRLTVGRHRFSAGVLLISCASSSDPQTHASLVTRVVWSKVFFFYLKTISTERTTRRSLGCRAPLDV